MDRAAEGRDLAAAVAGHDDIRGEQLLEPFEITITRRREEAVDEVAVVAAGCREPHAPFGHVLAGPSGELPGVGFGRADHLGDVRVLVVEDVVQQQRGPLLGREGLERDEQRERQGIRRFGLSCRDRPRVRHDRLGQPVADVRARAAPGGLQFGDREPGRDRRHEGGRRRAALRRTPPPGAPAAGPPARHPRPQRRCRACDTRPRTLAGATRRARVGILHTSRLSQLGGLLSHS